MGKIRGLQGVLLFTAYAICLPIPEVEPVINATLPFKLSYSIK